MPVEREHFKKQKLFFIAVQQCKEFATYADVQYIASVFFMLWQHFFFCQSLRSHTFRILMFNWYQWVTTHAVSHYVSHQDGGLFETWDAWEDIWQKVIHAKSNHPVTYLQGVKIWTGLTQRVSICIEVKL